MKPILFLLAVLGLGATAPAYAQSATDLYHDAARLYIDGQRAEADAAAVRGLSIEPDNTRLQALLALIRDEQPPQNGDESEDEQEQNDSEEQQSDESQDGESGQDGESQPDQQEDGRAERPDDQAAADGTGQNPQEPGEPPQNEDAESPGQNEPPPPGQDGATPQSASPVQPGRMSRAEAQRLLNAVGANEEQLLQRMQRQQARPRRVEKDW